MALSMGSVGRAAEARAPHSTSSAAAPVGGAPSRTARSSDSVHSRATRMRFSVRVPVLSAHRTAGAAERLYDRAAPHQNAVRREPPRAECEEHCQHHRKFFWDECDGDCYSRQRAGDPIVTCEPISNGDKSAEPDSKQTEQSDETPSRTLQRGRLLMYLRK